MNAKPLTFNKNQMTIKCGNKVTYYKDRHAFSTAWLHAAMLITHWSYQHYTKRYDQINTKGENV